MSRYYAYLTNLDKSTILTLEQWNAVVGENQATDNLLIGSLYPHADISMSSFYIEKNVTNSFIRYYTPLANFKNDNNPQSTEATSISFGSGNYLAHKILIPGFYAWNILWAEKSTSRTGDQVLGVKIRRVTQSQIDSNTDPEQCTVIGEFRNTSTSWASTTASYRYDFTSTSFGMGFPLHNYSGIHYFNAPPYGTEYEYIVFEFISSVLFNGSTTLNYFTFIQQPYISLMKVR